jgi:hypothetical protein
MNIYDFAIRRLPDPVSAAISHGSPRPITSHYWAARQEGLSHEAAVKHASERAQVTARAINALLLGST